MVFRGCVSCEFLRQQSSEASFVYFMVDTCTFIPVWTTVERDIIYVFYIVHVYEFIKCLSVLVLSTKNCLERGWKKFIKNFETYIFNENV